MDHFNLLDLKNKKSTDINVFLYQTVLGTCLFISPCSNNVMKDFPISNP